MITLMKDNYTLIQAGPPDKIRSLRYPDNQHPIKYLVPGVTPPRKGATAHYSAMRWGSAYLEALSPRLIVVDRRMVQEVG
jgi:hypothetical protein